jgi:hypothetical protein
LATLFAPGNYLLCRVVGIRCTAILRDALSLDLVIHPYTVEDFDIRLYGDCALLSGRTRMTETYQGRPFQSHYRYIDTYVHQDGRWRVCSVQIMALRE